MPSHSNEKLPISLRYIRSQRSDEHISPWRTRLSANNMEIDAPANNDTLHWIAIPAAFLPLRNPTLPASVAPFAEDYGRFARTEIGMPT